MQVSKLIVAVAVAAGFASASFAQGTATPAPQAAPTAKSAAPVHAVVEKKSDAAKAAEPAKAEVVKAEVVKPEAGKPAEKHGKAKAKGHEKQAEKAEVKPAATPAPAAK